MQIIISLSKYSGFNLAAEEFLYSRRRDEILFLYVNAPSVIIGCNQAVLNETDPDYCKKKGIKIMRRISGGGAVYHDEGNLNFSFIGNRKEGEYPVDSSFLNPVIEVLSGMGINVISGEKKDLLLPGGFKITGTASHIGKSRKISHGTMLFDSDLEMLELALTPVNVNKEVKAIKSVRSKVENLSRLLPGITFDEFFLNIQQKMVEYFCLDKVESLSENERAEIIKIQQNKYEDYSWTFKK